MDQHVEVKMMCVGELAMLKEHIRRLEDRNNKGHGNNIEEEVNEVLLSSLLYAFL
jgi:hypothetical protein